ncbi:MAG: hypothetical protein ABS35_41010 [Kaistia sp. SCN 65-12]|nr:MAG: hypothetical protein ABS35_41010 [Kaistia sp. SCN 65-12]
MTPASRFHNALRILTSIEVNDLRAACVVDDNWGTPEASDRAQLAAFVQDPIREALRMPDDNFDRLFALIESRQPVTPHEALGEADHTPGPWIVQRSLHRQDGEFDFAIHGDGVPVLAEVFGRDAHGGTPPADANARLIATAPEMAEALDRLVNPAPGVAKLPAWVYGIVVPVLKMARGQV